MALPLSGLYISVPGWALGWFLLGLGLVVEDETSELLWPNSYGERKLLSV